MRLTPLECRIIEQLDQDARLSAEAIGRRLRISGDTVLYTISKLSQNGIIERYSAIIDLFQLGLLPFRVSLRLTKNVALESVAEKLFKLGSFTLLVESRGEHDLICWGAASSLVDMQTAYAQCQEELEPWIRESSLQVIIETSTYSRGYLVNRPGKVFPTRSQGSQSKLDTIDRQILQALREDARMPVSSIASNLKITAAIVKYRISKMEDFGVISGYRVQLNAESIGLQRFRVQLEYSGKFSRCSEALRQFCKSTAGITRLEFQIGSWPAELGLETESFMSLHKVLDQLKGIAGGNIHVVGVVIFRRTLSAPIGIWNKMLSRSLGQL